MNDNAIIYKTQEFGAQPIKGTVARGGSSKDLDHLVPYRIVKFPPRAAPHESVRFKSGSLTGDHVGADKPNQGKPALRRHFKQNIKIALRLEIPAREPKNATWLTPSASNRGRALFNFSAICSRCMVAI
jgi:hypothetical protein